MFQTLMSTTVLTFRELSADSADGQRALPRLRQFFARFAGKNVVEKGLFIGFKDQINDRGVVSIADPGDRIWNDIDPFPQIREGEGCLRDSGIWDFRAQSRVKVLD